MEKEKEKGTQRRSSFSQMGYEYNSADEMNSAVETTSLGAVEKSVDFKYDINGLLIEEDVTISGTTTTTRYNYDGWNPAKAGAIGTSGYDVWGVFTGAGSLTSRQLQGDGINQQLGYSFMPAHPGFDPVWYLNDHLGSTRTTINNSGAAQAWYIYDAYSNVTSSSPSTPPPLYYWDGYIADSATGNDYARGASTVQPWGAGCRKIHWASMRAIATFIGMCTTSRRLTRTQAGSLRLMSNRLAKRKSRKKIQ